MIEIAIIGTTLVIVAGFAWAVFMPPEEPNNVIKLKAEQHDSAELVRQIKAVVYERQGKISVTEAIGAIELAKIEVIQEQ